MKRFLCLLFCFAFLLCMTSCRGIIIGAKTHNVESELYSQKEIQSAIDIIKKDFKENFSGCTLQEIHYAGDEISSSYQDHAVRNNADEVIVLKSDFYTGPFGGDGSLNANFTYENWSWILVRTKGGEWRHVDHGYG